MEKILPEQLVMDRMRYITYIVCLLLSLGIVFFFVSRCAGADMKKDQHSRERFQKIRQIPQQQWDELARKKIFFGHQSVGNNIMQGVREIMARDHNIHLHVVETRETSAFDKPIFAHYGNIGKNHQPLVKIRDFVQLMDDGLGNKLDIAFLKFCFVDFNAGTDVQGIFKKYKESMSELKRRYPGLTIVHFTVPLLRKEQEKGLVKSMKDFVRGLVGKKKDNFFSNSHNVVRNEYNQLLLDYYGGREPVFDLARLESTSPAGGRETFVQDGKKYYALFPGYTEDGGHLNEKGRKYIAEHLLVFLANLQTMMH